MNGTPVLAAYVCKPCDFEARGPEESPGVVRCWLCGQPATVTARLAGLEVRRG